MELFRFLLMSSLEYFAMIALMFAIFRFSFRGFIPHTIFICVLLSYISYTLRDMGYGEYAPLVQIMFFVVCVNLLYRVHWFYSILMGVVGYQSYVVIQVVVYVLLNKIFSILGYDTLSTYFVYCLQIISIIVPIMISYFLIRTGWGFTFVPIGDLFKIKLKKLNIVILMITVVLVWIIGFSIQLMYDLELFIPVSLLQLVLLIILLYYSGKKETEND